MISVCRLKHLCKPTSARQRGSILIEPGYCVVIAEPLSWDTYDRTALSFVSIAVDTYLLPRHRESRCHVNAARRYLPDGYVEVDDLLIELRQRFHTLATCPNFGEHSTFAGASQVFLIQKEFPDFPNPAKIGLSSNRLTTASSSGSRSENAIGRIISRPWHPPSSQAASKYCSE